MDHPRRLKLWEIIRDNQDLSDDELGRLMGELYENNQIDTVIGHFGLSTGDVYKGIMAAYDSYIEWTETGKEALDEMTEFLDHTPDDVLLVILERCLTRGLQGMNINIMQYYFYPRLERGDNAMSKELFRFIVSVLFDRSEQFWCCMFLVGGYSYGIVTREEVRDLLATGGDPIITEIVESIIDGNEIELCEHLYNNLQEYVVVRNLGPREGFGIKVVRREGHLPSRRTTNILLSAGYRLIHIVSNAVATLSSNRTYALVTILHTYVSCEDLFSRLCACNVFPVGFQLLTERAVISTCNKPLREYNLPQDSFEDNRRNFLIKTRHDEV